MYEGLKKRPLIIIVNRGELIIWRLCKPCNEQPRREQESLHVLVAKYRSSSVVVSHVAVIAPCIRGATHCQPSLCSCSGAFTGS